VAPRACVRVYARVLMPPNLYIHTHIHTLLLQSLRTVCYKLWLLRTQKRSDTDTYQPVGGGAGRCGVWGVGLGWGWGDSYCVREC